MRQLMKDAGVWIKGNLSHRFRDTAVDFWLSEGRSVEQVAAYLGDTVRTVERHYADLASKRMGDQIGQDADAVLGSGSRTMSTLLTVRDVAQILQCGEDAVVKRFARLPGVIDLGRAETRAKRRYRVLRIPKDVVEKYLAGKSGRSVEITVPDRPERRRKSPKWEDKAVLNLAKAGVQNDADKGTYRRLADKALLLKSIPERLWVDVLDGWFDESD